MMKGENTKDRIGKRGLIYGQWGGPEKLRYDFLPPHLSVCPDSVPLKPGHILVRVKAISINPVDWKIMSGSQRLIAESRFPRIFGTDFSGVVYRVGGSGGRSGFFEGDRVFGMISPLFHGSGRQWLSVKAAHCIRIPDGMTFAQAASLPAAGISAIKAASCINRRKPGRALVFGAAGGVGTLAVQLLARKGWEITAVARPEQRELLENLGCTSFLSRENWAGEIGGKWDVLIDCPAAVIGKNPGQYLEKGGCYSPVYIPDSFIPAQLLRTILWFFQPRSTGLFLAYPSARRMKKLEELIGDGSLKPVVNSIRDRKDCQKALSDSISGGISGKIIIGMENDAL